MKKSNIILVGIIGVFIIILIVLQLQVKSFVKNVKELERVYPVFDEFVIESGWYVELHIDSVARISYHTDSLIQFVSLQDNRLTVRSLDRIDNERGVFKISSPDIRKINIKGNSTVYYYNNSIDSLSLKLYNKSNIVITTENAEDSTLTNNQIASYIEHIDFHASNKSRINIYNNINTISGSLNDSSYIFLDEAVNELNIKKSTDSRINSW